MFTKILIANRAEIACRVARTARAMGIRSVAVYSDADARALHVQACDEAYRLGPPAPRESYLNGDAIIAIAKRAGAQAIHPGYGFLSENEGFAAACEAAGVVFIGPPPKAIAAMGSKSAAKRIMAAAGVPVVPGYHGDEQDEKLLAREAERIGYPVLIKAVAGGGGKGMKIVTRPAEFSAALASARREAQASFADDRVLIEKYLQSPRHIEMQVFADTHGNALHLFERDCSVQRRHQKVIEEAPAPHMQREVRATMGAAAVAAAQAIGYVGAGTVEFIAGDEFARDGRFYFMEMNTRLQVEHPVTEMITGVDLVEWQLRVAAGEALPVKADDLVIRGHAIEARIYAEDPQRGLLPSIGRIAHWRMPAQSARVRVDTGFCAGDEVSPYYDPMLAKLIVWGEDRERARQTLADALRECQVVGVATNVAMLERIVALPAFASGHVQTGLIDEHRDEVLAAHPTDADAWMAVACFDYASITEGPAVSAAGDRYSPWHLRDGWTNGSSTLAMTLRYRDKREEVRLDLRPQAQGVEVALRDRSAVVQIDRNGNDILVRGDDMHLRATVVARGDTRDVFGPHGHSRLHRVDPLAHTGVAEEHAAHLTAPMSGTVVAVMVEAGQRVEKGAPLVVLEAMKMEHTIAAPAAARVAAVNCAVGERVSEGSDLVDLADED
ncbi:MAG TPA: acetyl/propionyl/methylcrotonyl-CoA carboxylase subunit alpha [Casimicrobiaceae bacterium]|nr:acetyl/propionyl/methylcrotonyl-CoA carboxylase subunit alpha [Casimicrobiaceae bacterium]